MANFYPWIDAANDNVMSASDFANDDQRKNGFQAGQAASSARVNSALRQANLFVAALAEVILANDATLNLTSSVDAVKTALAGAHPFNLNLWKNGTSLSGITNNNTFGNTNINSVAFGSGNSISSYYSFAFGTSNTISAVGGGGCVFALGTGLNAVFYTFPKFVFGQYNKPCGDCVRETGAGTASARKTIEKLDKDGNLYVKSLHLSDDISESDNVEDGVLNKSTLKNLVTLANNLAADWTEQSFADAKLPEAGTYHIRGYYNGTYSDYFDFGLIYFDGVRGISLPTRGAKPKLIDPDTGAGHLITGFILYTGRIQIVVDDVLMASGASGYTGSKIWYKKIW